MSFKILQTMEEGEQCLCIVPSAWEKDGILWWPKATGAAKLLRDEYSHPTSKWQQMVCIQKREYRTLLEAESELERMEALSDTETEEMVSFKNSCTRRVAPKTSMKHFLKDFNGILQPADYNFQSVQGEVPGTLEDTGTPNTFYLPSTVLEEEMSAANIETIDNTSCQAVSLEDIATNQARIIDNQNKMITVLAQLKASFDYLNEKVMQMESGPDKSASEVYTKDFFKPVESLEMLDDLESILKDETVISRYVKNMSYICGTTSKEDGIDCCYRLIDYFMTRQFLTRCTWTGISRDNTASVELNEESEPQMKIPFMTYRRVRLLFLKLVLQADSSFTAMKCDEFFKRVLKISKQRLLSKTVSKHKNRPKRLQYGARQHSLQQGAQ
ncbi:uncharacterized protein LOC131692899 isoform X2 [Topomyia yanbarensis]|uniref:uncharacterized protein LOC131692899 isoform X2 n=1 Tax=Topomyia yanbarensis TaxID=2498891 RepID=UPI00273CE06F|nr:uncharacterized protein LOC131692899 isoform X2 [Topomyia yanbarensis]